MFFSVNYSSKHAHEADEVKYPLTYIRLLSKMYQKYSEKRYVLCTESKDIKSIEKDINSIREYISNYTVECSDIRVLYRLIADGYRAFLKYPISDWESFMMLKDLGVSDIYIDGPLGFQEKELKVVTNDTDLKLRVSPTLSPNIALVGADPRSFFIRPEDLHLYEGIISTLDFQILEQEKADVLFDVYKREEFLYDISLLLENCKFHVPNGFLKTEFGSSRLNCGQRCKIPGHSCHLCETQISLTNTVYNYFSELEKEEENDQAVEQTTLDTTKE